MAMLRVGAVGSGRATQELTLLAFPHVTHGELVAICDPNKALVEKVAEEANVKAYTDMVEMITVEKLDVVIMNTPVALHAELTIAAMKAGAHVIVEKPAVAKISELHDIRRASEETGKKFTVVHNYKYYPGPQKALKMYEDGLLGEILHVDRYWMTPPQNDRMESNKEGWWHKAEGGRLADALPHFLYVPYMFLGKMELLSVAARKLSDRSWSFCDESTVTLQTDKAYMHIRQSINQDSWPYKGYIYHTFIYGSKLTVMTNHHDAVILWRQSNKRDVLTGLKSLVAMIKHKLTPRKNVVTRGAHNVFYDKFFLYVMGKGENPSAWEEILNVASLTDEIGAKIQECVDGNKKAVLADGV